MDEWISWLNAPGWFMSLNGNVWDCFGPRCEVACFVADHYPTLDSVLHEIQKP